MVSIQKGLLAAALLGLFVFAGCREAGQLDKTNELKARLSGLSLYMITEPNFQNTGYNTATAYVKDDYGNCYLLVFNANGHGIIHSVATIPCSSIIKPKKEGCE